MDADRAVAASPLAARVAGFVATLRANGFTVGLAETEDAVRLAAQVGLLERDRLCWSWRSLLCARPEEWHRFGDLFDSYFLPPNKRAMVESRGGGAGRVALADDAAAPGGKAGPVLQSGGEDGRADALPEGAANAGASAEASLETEDFRNLGDAGQTRAVEVLIRRFARRMKRLRIRREREDRLAQRIDLRRTLRSSVGAGGAPARLCHAGPRRIRPRLVVLLDVSRSMSLYSFFYLRVARALALELGDVHVFLYHTHLTHVSDALGDPDPWRAQERLQLLSAGWAGGTRIGECLGSFNRQHAGRLVHGRTAVIIGSDGYETGEPGLLGREMAALAARARRIVWLNPGRAVPGWTPASRGMSEALPHVDLLAAGHSLAALEPALAGVLEVL